MRRPRARALEARAPKLSRAPNPPRAPSFFLLSLGLDRYAFKLEAGDWLMLDNLRVQHGRLPYEPDEANPRVLLTVYADPVRATAPELVTRASG